MDLDEPPKVRNRCEGSCHIFSQRGRGERRAEDAKS